MTRAAPVVAFRADASQRIGTGHVRRCLALADALLDAGASPLFVVRDLGLPPTSPLGDAHAVVTLPRPTQPFRPEPGDPPYAAWGEVPQAIDAAQTIEALAAREPSLVVVDSYAFDARWHQAVAQSLGAAIVAIDDLGDRPLDVSAIVDHNYVADPLAKHRLSLGPNTKLLTGPSYALLDRAFATAPRYRFSEAVRSIGIFMGGVDAGGLSLPIAQALRDVGFAGHIAIATTSANPSIAMLQTAAAELGIDVALDLPHLADFFAAHDLQIGASGGATWERCCIGAPTLAVTVAANQREVLDPLATFGVVEMLDGDVPNAGEIAAAARRLIDDPRKREELGAKARLLVDGRGAARVASELLAL